MSLDVLQPEEGKLTTLVTLDALMPRGIAR